MRRTLGSAFVLLVLVAPATAQAGEVSGALVSCTGGDFCRYFPEPRLEVTFRAAPGERNELSIRPNPDGVRIVDAGAGIEPRAFCTAVDANAAQCGPQPAAGLIATARTGDGADSAFADIGSVFLGRGDDHGISEGASLYGGPGQRPCRGQGQRSRLRLRAGHLPGARLNVVYASASMPCPSHLQLLLLPPRGE